MSSLVLQAKILGTVLGLVAGTAICTAVLYAAYGPPAFLYGAVGSGALAIATYAIAWLRLVRPARTARR